MPQHQAQMAATSSKDALAAYLKGIEDADAATYAVGTQFNFVAWRVLQIAALAVALLGSAASAVLGNEDFKNSTALWIASVVLPLVSGALTASISQTKVAELHMNRRRNSAKVRFLIDDGWAQFHSAQADPEFLAIHRSIAAEVEKVRGSWAE